MTKKESLFIRFVHIEKSGGITLHNILHRNFFRYLSPSPLSKFGDVFTAAQFARLKYVWPFKITGIGGHKIASYEDYSSSIDQEIFTFTFVREPISRYISHYNWQKLVMKKDWSLDGFLNDEQFNNFQCYRISGNRDFEIAKKELLKNYSFVGMIEDYDRSVLMLELMIGPKFSPMYQVSNSKDYLGENLILSDLSDAEIKRIRKANAEDLKLYHYVKTELYPKYRNIHKVNNRDVEKFIKARRNYKFSRVVLFKRALTNQLLAKIFQPLCSFEGLSRFIKRKS